MKERIAMSQEEGHGEVKTLYTDWNGDGVRRIFHSHPVTQAKLPSYGNLRPSGQ